MDRYNSPEAAYRAAILRGEDLGVIRTEHYRGTSWKGSRADLIAAGVCDERHFPEGRKRITCGNEDGRPGVKSWNTSAIILGHFVHYVSWDEDYLREHPREPQEQPHPVAGDPEDFAGRCEDFFASTCEMLVDLVSGNVLKSEALRYDAATVDKVRAALDHAQQLLQSSIPTLPCGYTQREKRANAAKGDAAFQSFIRTAIAIDKPKKPRRGARS